MNSYIYLCSFKAVLKHVLGNGWRDHFDYVIVNAAKPAWFNESRAFRQVPKRYNIIYLVNRNKFQCDTTTGHSNGIYAAPVMSKDNIYSEGY